MKNVDHARSFYRRQILAVGEHTGAFHLLVNMPRGHRERGLKKALVKFSRSLKAPGAKLGRGSTELGTVSADSRLYKDRAALRERSPGSLM